MALAYDPTYFNQGAQALGQAASYAAPPSNYVQTASSRLQARLEGRRRAQESAIRDQFANRGTFGGGYNTALRQNDEATTGAYATGLAQIEDDFQKQRADAAKTLTGVGQGYGELGSGQAGAINYDNQNEIDLKTLGLKDKELNIQEKANDNQNLSMLSNVLPDLLKLWDPTNQSNQLQEPIRNAINELFRRLGISGIPAPTGGSSGGTGSGNVPLGL